MAEQKSIFGFWRRIWILVDRSIYQGFAFLKRHAISDQLNREP
jgi:hypothetical protein